MGFYGNVTNTDKTTFSFDLIYATRYDMDRNANEDGVFLGRYVLIDYDEEPIKAYYDSKTDRFYNTANYAAGTQLIPRKDVIYQDLHNAASYLSFYEWNETYGRHELVKSNSPY
jgi:hypothetical protein